MKMMKRLNLNNLFHTHIFSFIVLYYSHLTSEVLNISFPVTTFHTTHMQRLNLFLFTMLFLILIRIHIKIAKFWVKSWNFLKNYKTSICRQWLCKKTFYIHSILNNVVTQNEIGNLKPAVWVCFKITMTKISSALNLNIIVWYSEKAIPSFTTISCSDIDTLNY